MNTHDLNKGEVKMKLNKKGSAVLGFVLVGVVIGIFAGFVGHLQEKAAAFTAAHTIK